MLRNKQPETWRIKSNKYFNRQSAIKIKSFINDNK